LVSMPAMTCTVSPASRRRPAGEEAETTPTTLQVAAGRRSEGGQKERMQRANYPSTAAGGQQLPSLTTTDTAGKHRSASQARRRQNQGAFGHAPAESPVRRSSWAQKASAWVAWKPTTEEPAAGGVPWNETLDE
jgi:hypothetical protein